MCPSHDRLRILDGQFLLAFRFIHTADLHLDAPLKAMALRDPGLAAEIGTASRTAFSRIVDLCIDEAVAFLLIAGDLWDGNFSSTRTPRFLKEELLRLVRAGIGCFIIRGNHDALARQTGELEAPALTVVFPGRARTVELEIDGHAVAIHGLSFRDAQMPDSLLPQYPAPKAGAFNIGMMHTSLNGSPGHDTYAPCSLADLEAQGYDYWALGHIHRRQEYRGHATIVMPGIPQGRDIGEAGRASVTLVRVDDANRVTLEPRSVAALRFDRLALDCTGLADWPALLSRMDQALRTAGAAPREEDHLVLRLALTGATPLAWRIARDLDRLTDEARAFAAGCRLWIDKLEIGLALPGTDGPGAALPAELVRIVTEDLPADPAVAAALLAAAQEISRDLPAELRDMLGRTEAEMAAHCRALLDDGIPAMLDALAPDTAD